jgi:F420-non-reducing hydrogenase iron-sulfur subunit
MPFLQNLLSYIGINPQRLRLDWVSSAEAPKFAQVATEFVEVVRELGPLVMDKEGARV